MRKFIISLLTALTPFTAYAQDANISADNSIVVPQAPAQRADLIAGLEDRHWYPTTGKDLLTLVEGCEEASCMSFVSGLITGLATKEFLMGRDNPFCAGDHIATQDIRDALVTVLNNDQELQKMPVAFSLLATFSVTWPCETQEDVLAQDDAQTNATAFTLDDMTQLDPGSILTVFENYPGALTLGNLAAPTVKTIVVFHDPNCAHCQEFKKETYTLANTGWKVIVMPVGILGENSVAYSAMMYALSETRPDVVEALYQEVVPGEANVESAMDIVAQFDITPAQLLGLVSRTNAYESVEANNQLFGLLDAKGTPAWMISDYIFTGGMDAQSIVNVARDIPVPPGQVGFDRPGMKEDSEKTPLILPDNSETND